MILFCCIFIQRIAVISRINWLNKSIARANFFNYLSRVRKICETTSNKKQQKKFFVNLNNEIIMFKVFQHKVNYCKAICLISYCHWNWWWWWKKGEVWGIFLDDNLILCHIVSMSDDFNSILVGTNMRIPGSCRLNGISMKQMELQHTICLSI